MRIQFRSRSEIDDSSLRRRQITAKERAQFALDEQVLKDSNYFIPKSEGYLEASGLMHSRLGNGHIEWNTPYARRLYYNPEYNFSKDINPNAQGLWFEAAKALHKREWVDIVKDIYEDHY